MQSVSGQVRTVQFACRQPSQCFGYSNACHSFRLIESFAYDHLGYDTARGDSGTASERLELSVLYATVLDLDIQFHNVAAHRIAYLAYAIRILDNTHVTGVQEMVYDFI
jgi:hypothetical protein